MTNSDVTAWFHNRGKTRKLMKLCWRIADRVFTSNLSEVIPILPSADKQSRLESAASLPLSSELEESDKKLVSSNDALPCWTEDGCNIFSTHTFSSPISDKYALITYCVKDRFPISSMGLEGDKLKQSDSNSSSKIKRLNITLQFLLTSIRINDEARRVQYVPLDTSAFKENHSLDLISFTKA